ncbi:hypothetical protein [Penaeicola halotolerans]|uniref:hypothetical protein n=1 Tax=Penaeicola halotolerans TaxID=2793196 RepID=UPI001CF7F3E3|nr:hypothetical protein [Penaeicola halotolerans]
MDKLRSKIENMNGLPPNSSWSKDQGWKKLESRLEKKSKRIFIPIWSRWAAGLILLGTLTYLLVNKSSEISLEDYVLTQIEPETSGSPFSTANNQVNKIDLSDDSKKATSSMSSPSQIARSETASIHVSNRALSLPMEIPTVDSIYRLEIRKRPDYAAIADLIAENNSNEKERLIQLKINTPSFNKGAVSASSLSFTTKFQTP